MSLWMILEQVYYKAHQVGNDLWASGLAAAAWHLGARCSSYRIKAQAPYTAVSPGHGQSSNGKAQVGARKGPAIKLDDLPACIGIPTHMFTIIPIISTKADYKFSVTLLPAVYKSQSVEGAPAKITLPIRTNQQTAYEMLHVTFSDKLKKISPRARSLTVAKTPYVGKVCVGSWY